MGGRGEVDSYPRGCFFILTQSFLKSGRLELDRIKAMAGIAAFTKGSASFAAKKKITITRYVRTNTMIFLDQLVSQDLSASTRWLRDFISFNSFWRFSRVDIGV